MKKTFLPFFMLLFAACLAASAQTERGNIMIGGNMNLRIPTNDGETVQQSYLSLTPNVGFFLADNVALGFGLPISSNRYRDNRTGYTSRSSSFGFAPFGRYYFGASNIKPFLEGRFGIEHFKSEETGKAGNRDEALFVGFGAGLAMFLNEHVALEPKLSYDAYSRGGTNSAFNINIGFQVYLR
jgi:hypothetical protein